MSRPKKRRRRILLVAAISLVATAAGFAVYSWRQHADEVEALHAREVALAAFAAGDYVTARDQMGVYLFEFGKRGATADDWVAYARARRRVEIPNGGHLLQSIPPLQRALSMEPRHALARKELLEVFLAVGYGTEALELAESMLADAPTDASLLRTKVALLDHVRRFPEALEAARRLQEAAPDSVDDCFATARILARAEASTEQVDEWLAGTLARNPGDARFELLRASALTLRGDEAGAKRSLDLALEAIAASKDPSWVPHLVRELDTASRFADSLSVLDRAADSAGEEVRLELLRRYWYAGRAADLVARLDRWRLPADGSGPEVEALAAIALQAAGRDADGAACRGRLLRRTDAAGRGWSALVHAYRPGASVPPDEIVRTMKPAVAAAPGCAAFRQSLGDAYAALGEPELAMRSWTGAAGLARSWSRPLQKIAQTLLVSGREHLAVTPARDAFLRAPNDVAAIMVYLEAMAGMAGRLEPKAAASLRQAFESLLADEAAQADEALAAYVELLVRTDRDAAEKQLRAVVDAQRAPPEAVLLRLARTAEENGLALAAQLFDRSEQAHGASPVLALARALSRARRDGTDAGLAELDAVRARAKPGAAAPLDWDLVRTTYLDGVHRPDAGKAWIALADAHPQAIQPQLGALSSSGVWSDRPAVDRIVERVRELSGEEAVTWRVARARWLLDNESATDADVANAARLLGDVVRDVPGATPARTLLARALERLGNLEGAEEQLRIAADQTERNAAIHLELARIAQRRGRPDVARRHLDQVLARDDLPPEHVERAAYLVAMQGDFRRGADLLAPLDAASRAPREGTLLLARLYARLGETERALALCEKLLLRPDADAVELTAALQASLGRPSEATATLTTLDTLPLAAGQKELVLARHAAAWDTPETALRRFAEATAAAPARADLWSARLIWTVTLGDAAAFQSCLDDPSGGAIESVAFLRSLRGPCVAALRDPRLRPMILTAVEDAASRPLLVDVLGAVSGAGRSPAERTALAKQVRGLADAHPELLALQLLAAQLCAEAGDFGTGSKIAERAATRFPNSAAPARQVAELLSEQRRWEEALAAARAWRDRAPAGDVAPEVMLAELEVRTGQPQHALARLEPHMEAARLRPQANARLLLAWAFAQVRSSRPDAAGELFSELAARDAAWRSLPSRADAARLVDAATARAWFRAAANAVPAEDAAARLALARGWASAYEAFGESDFAAEASRLLVSIVKDPSAPASAHLLAAGLAQQRGDLDAARAGYARVLELEPASLPARNNLAMVLADLDMKDEAVAEARRVVAASPAEPEYRDTLAYALRRSGQAAAAIPELDEAVRLDPANPSWRVSLAETYAELRDWRAADRCLTQAEGALAGRGTIPEPLRRRIEQVRNQPR